MEKLKKLLSLHKKGINFSRRDKHIERKKTLRELKVFSFTSILAIVSIVYYITYVDTSIQKDPAFIILVMGLTLLFFVIALMSFFGWGEYLMMRKNSIEELEAEDREEYEEKMEDAFLSFLPYYSQWVKKYEEVQNLNLDFIPREYSHETKKILEGMKEKYAPRCNCESVEMTDIRYDQRGNYFHVLCKGYVSSFIPNEK